MPALRGRRNSDVSTGSVLMVRLQWQNLTGLKVPSRPSLSLSGTLGRIPSGSPPPPSDSRFRVFLLPPKTLCIVDLQSLSWRPSGSPEVPWTAPPRSGLPSPPPLQEVGLPSFTPKPAHPLWEPSLGWGWGQGVGLGWQWRAKPDLARGPEGTWAGAGPLPAGAKGLGWGKMLQKAKRVKVCSLVPADLDLTQRKGNLTWLQCEWRTREAS